MSKQLFLPYDLKAARPQDLRQPAQNALAIPVASSWQWPIEDTNAGNFHYIGQALTPAQFRQYCIDYKSTGQFGTYPPSYVVYHHTYNPDHSLAPVSSNPNTYWDRNESGLTLDQIKTKRKPQLDAIMKYYRDTLKWNVGPHLFIDEYFVWLFTPLFYIGIHCNEGNSYYRNGILRYSIGVEVIGYYDQVVWPRAIYDNVGYATACLQHVLGFELKYTSAPEDRPDMHDPQLSSHADYTDDKSCPGNAITPAFYVQCAKDGYARYQSASNDPLRQRTITGPPPNNQMIYCSVAAFNFYAMRGGLPIMGFPVKDEYWATDPNGVLCSVLKCQRGAIKTSTRFGTELMLIEEEALPMNVYVKPVM